MESIKNLFSHYFFKFVFTLVVAMFFSAALKLYVVSGIVLIVFTLFIFINSFKDANFKSKKLVAKIFIYFFILVFLLSGVTLLGGDPNKSANSIRHELNN